MAHGQLHAVIRHLRRLVHLKTASHLTDAQLLQRFVAARDEAAFELLVWRHGATVLGVCRRVLRHEHDADDAFQATFLILVRKAGTIGKREAVGSWLYKVAFRVALAARARAAKRAARERDRANLRSAAEPSSGVLWHDLGPLLDEEVNRLPAKYRIPFVLCYVEGRTVEETARHLGWPRGTVGTRLAGARERLRTRLARRGVTLTAGALTGAFSQSGAFATLPAPLVVATVDAAMRFAAGGAAAGVVSAPVAALTKGVLQAMLLTKLKITTALILAVGVLTLGVGTLTYPGSPHRAATVAAGVLPPPTFEPQERAKPVAPPVQAQEPKPPAQPPAPPKPKSGDQRVKAEEVITKTFTTKGSPRVVVGTFNGGLRVTTGGPGTVAAKVIKNTTAGTPEEAQEELKKVEVTMQQDGDTVTITARRVEDQKPQVNRGASVELQVPAGAVLALETSNGGVTVTGATGDVTAHSSNGGIQVKGSKGKLQLTTNNGGIRAEGGGRLDLKTTNGALVIRTENAVVAAHTSNGSIQLTGRLAQGNHSLATSNGSITLTLPADAQFRLDAGTSRGAVSSAFSWSQKETTGKTSLRGTVGADPSVAIKLRTSNGSIALRRQE
jgi:RNA polymerase sigma factor (sigma-70 family)